MQMCVCDFFLFDEYFPRRNCKFSIENYQRDDNIPFSSKIEIIIISLLVNRLSLASVGKSYETILEESAGFDNPQCIEHLSQTLGLDSSVFYTNMSGLRGKYPNEEYATDLRQSQASSWAFR